MQVYSVTYLKKHCTAMQIRATRPSPMITVTSMIVKNEGPPRLRPVPLPLPISVSPPTPESPGIIRLSSGVKVIDQGLEEQ